MTLSENSTTEFKQKYTSNINKTVIPFANTNDGTAYVGSVDDIDGIMLKPGNSIFRLTFFSSARQRS